MIIAIKQEQVDYLLHLLQALYKNSYRIGQKNKNKRYQQFKQKKRFSYTQFHGVYKCIQHKESIQKIKISINKPCVSQITKIIILCTILMILMTVYFIIIIMIFIPSNQQYLDLQHAYNDLQSKYITTTSTLQQNLALLAQLKTQFQKVKSQNNSLKNILRINKLQSDQISQEQKEQVQDIQIKQELEVKKEYNQMNAPISHAQCPKANFKLKRMKIFKCPYQNCSKSYERRAFMSIHIQRKHKGGTKAQRQAFAKAMLQAIQKGETLPMHKNITLPPNFLIEFRKTYQSQKKQDT